MTTSQTHDDDSDDGFDEEVLSNRCGFENEIAHEQHDETLIRHERIEARIERYFEQSVSKQCFRHRAQ